MEARKELYAKRSYEREGFMNIHLLRREEEALNLTEHSSYTSSLEESYARVNGNRNLDSSCGLREKSQV